MPTAHFNSGKAARWAHMILMGAGYAPGDVRRIESVGYGVTRRNATWEFHHTTEAADALAVLGAFEQTKDRDWIVRQWPEAGPRILAVLCVHYPKSKGAESHGA